MALTCFVGVEEEVDHHQDPGHLLEEEADHRASDSEEEEDGTNQDPDHEARATHARKDEENQAPDPLDQEARATIIARTEITRAKGKKSGMTSQFYIKS